MKIFDYMRKFLKYILAAIPAAAMLATASCSADFMEESDFPMSPETGKTPVLEFDGDNSVKVSKDGGEYEFSFKANLPWMMESKASWITLTGETTGSGGKDNIKVSFSVTRNGTVNPREGEIRIWITDESEMLVKVSQEATPIEELGSKWYVKTDGTGDGSSWSSATTLSNALAKAVDNDKIFVAAGTHFPTEMIAGGASPQDRTFFVAANVTIEGGFPANAKEGDTSDPLKNQTILSGNTADGEVYHVMVVAAPKSEMFKVNVSGVTITGGKCNSTAQTLNINGAKIHRSYGGGVVIGNSNATFTDCIITANNSPKYCAGLYNADGAETRLLRCSVTDNTSGGNGAGIWNGATLYMKDCQVKGNTNTGVGAGIYCLNNNKTTNKVYIYNTAFLNNATDGSKASRRGGGAYLREGSEGIIANCTFAGNTGANGSAIALYGTATLSSKLTVASCTITGNESKFYGALESGPNTTLNIYNSIVSGNTCVNPGYENIVVTKSDAPIQSLPAVLAYSIDGSTVYGKNKTVESGLSFDFETMLGAIRDGVIALTGTSNPATSNGMPLEELKAITTGMEPEIDQEILSADQKGNKRTSDIMGSYIGQ